METLLAYFFGKWWVFFNAYVGNKAAVWFKEFEIAMNEKKVRQQTAIIEDLKSTIESGVRSDGSKIEDKEFSALKAELNDQEKRLKGIEATTEMFEAEMAPLIRKRDFLAEYRPKLLWKIVVVACVVMVVWLWLR